MINFGKQIELDLQVASILDTFSHNVYQGSKSLINVKKLEEILKSEEIYFDNESAPKLAFALDKAGVICIGGRMIHFGEQTEQLVDALKNSDNPVLVLLGKRFDRLLDEIYNLESQIYATE